MRLLFSPLLVFILWPRPPAIAQAGKQPRPALARCGPLVDRVFSCPRFAFTYKMPFGWVDRTRDAEEAADGETRSAGSPGAASGQAQTLFEIFERPPDAAGETINSAVVVAQESLASYAGVKTAADYFGPIADIAEQHGFTMLDDPYSFSIGRKQLVRGDFSRERGKLKMLESSLVMIDKGYIVSFTFIAGSEEEVEELIAGLSFAATTAYPQTRRPRS